MNEDSEPRQPSQPTLHDLGNLLAVILGRVQYLLPDPDACGPARRLECLTAIEDAARQGRDILLALRRRVVLAPYTLPGETASPDDLETAALDEPVRVLLIDDDPRVLETLAGLLRAAGHEVETALGGMQGIERWRRRPSPCVITDLGMRGLTGLMVSRIIKDTDASTYVVVLTGSDEVDPQALHAAGVDRVERKPVTRDQLLAVVAASRRRGAAVPAPATP